MTIEPAVALSEAESTVLDVELYRQIVSLSLSNARSLAVPTDEETTKTLLERFQALFEAGVPLLNLAAFFVPPLGAVLLVSTGIEMLSEVYTGFEDWSHGDVVEAFDHFGAATKNLTVMSVGAKATAHWSAVRSEIDTLSFMDDLHWVKTSIARARVVELQKGFRAPKEGKIDEVAIYLDYTTQLAERLALPWSLSGTRLTSRDVTLGRLNNAYQAVIDTEQGAGLRDQISEQPGWREYLESEYWSKFAQIRSKLQAAQRSRPVGQTSVAEWDAKLRSIGVEYQQLVQTLTQQMLDSDADPALRTALKTENNVAP